jgi:hypothetical protein
VKENLVQRKKGKAPKWDSNIVPNDYWVTSLLHFINPNESRGKIDVTHNRGPNVPRNFDHHKTRSKNKKGKEDAAAFDCHEPHPQSAAPRSWLKEKEKE